MDNFTIYLVDVRQVQTQTKESITAELLEAAKMALFDFTHDGHSKVTIDYLRTVIMKAEIHHE